MRFHRILAVFTMAAAAFTAFVGTASASIISDVRVKKDIEAA
jgi:hypothetical protein